MSVEDIQRGIHEAVGTLPYDALLRARTLLDEAATTLAEVTVGSDDATLHETVAHHRRTRDDIDRALAVCAQVRTTCDDYLASIGALSVDTAPPSAPTQPEQSPSRPLHPHLDDHVFRGHIRYKQFTGYHSRPGGVDTGDIQVGEPETRDAEGCYRAPATATTRNGKKMTRPKTFFPDHWTPEEVRHAIRTAFTHRRSARDSEGETKPNIWRGSYQGVIIEGKLFPATDFDSATLDDVGTAYPIPDIPEEGTEP